jgi:hypothetical protein
MDMDAFGAKASEVIARAVNSPRSPSRPVALADTQMKDLPKPIRKNAAHQTANRRL